MRSDDLERLLPLARNLARAMAEAKDLLRESQDMPAEDFAAAVANRLMIEAEVAVATAAYKAALDEIVVRARLAAATA